MKDYLNAMFCYAMLCNVWHRSVNRASYVKTYTSVLLTFYWLKENTLLVVSLDRGIPVGANWPMIKVAFSCCLIIIHLTSSDNAKDVHL